MRLLVLALILIAPIIGKAFPQMIRHGYTNCMTCHVNPRGGNQLTDYGRALSKELLSTWDYEGEEQWHFGAIDKAPKWLKLGGDFRAIQVHTKTEQATIGRFIEMQEQVELGLDFGKTRINITPSSDTLQKGKPWGIHRFFVQSQLSDHFVLQVGKFVPRFGINTPEHIFSTRGPLGFGYQAERQTLEAFYVKSQWDFSLALTRGLLRDRTDATGFYSQANYSFGSSDRIGISVEKKVKDNKALSLGLHGLVGMSEHLYLVSEVVYRESEALPGETDNGVFAFSKLGYEIEKGLHIFSIGDLKKAKLAQNGSTDSFYGLGFSFFPRPHVELQGVFAKRKNLARSRKEGDFAWILMHFYL